MEHNVHELVTRFQAIHHERMEGLPIVNPVLTVEAVGFDWWEGHRLGVLITPWFINLIVLPGSDEWSVSDQGSLVRIDFPSGPCELTVCRDEVLGTYLAAVLFRTVVDFPDQLTARVTADEALLSILSTPPPADTRVNRRDLLTGLRAG